MGADSLSALGKDVVAVDLPWDCTLRGVPASLQGSAHKRADWRLRVSAAAARRWPAHEPPLEEPLALLVAFLHSGQPVDVDNMLKPTLDGLTGVCYVDDAQLEQVIGVRWDLSRTLRLERLSPVLVRAVVAAVADGGPFVYLRLRPPIELEEMLR